MKKKEMNEKNAVFYEYQDPFKIQKMSIRIFIEIRFKILNFVGEDDERHSDDRVPSHGATRDMWGA